MPVAEATTVPRGIQDPTAANVKPSAVVYKKTTLKKDYMKYPANAAVFGRVGANKGKLILACGILDGINVLDPDTGELIRCYGPEYGTTGVVDDVREGPDGTLYFSQFFPGNVG